MVVHSNYLVAAYIRYKFKKGKRKKKLYLKIIGLLHYYTLLTIEFLLFSTVSLFVKIVSPIRTFVAVCLIVSLVINILEDMRTRFTFLCSKP